jgi:hypothetical protein
MCKLCYHEKRIEHVGRGRQCGFCVIEKKGSCEVFLSHLHIRFAVKSALRAPNISSVIHWIRRPIGEQACRNR